MRQIRSRVAYQLMSSDDTVLAFLPRFYVDCSGTYVTIVVRDRDEGVFLIFSANAVSGITQNQAGESIASISFNSEKPQIYKVVFTSYAEALEWSSILDRLSRHTGAPQSLVEFVEQSWTTTGARPNTLFANLDFYVHVSGFLQWENKCQITEIFRYIQRCTYNIWILNKFILNRRKSIT